ncbi:MAG: peptidase S41 [Peptococcaceae bacterium BICA1-7]|nr:MAG: peptidase S41 [Peptococcaceae bacterium BICA1-7]
MSRYGLNRTGGRFFTVLAVIIFTVIVGFGWLLASNYKHFGNLIKVIVLVKTQYLDTANYDAMVDGAIKGVVESLNDPYSAYLDPVTYKQLQEQIRGSFGGLGVLVGMKGEYLTVARTYSGTPAYQKGLQPGDVIYKIDGREAQGIDLETAVQLMRGPVGTQVTLTIIRPNSKEPFDVPLTRQEIRVPTVEGKMLKNDIAYILISQFSEKTPEELGEVIDKLKSEGMRGIVLDLRNNPGGELKSAVRVASNFVPAGPVVFIEYKGGRLEEHQATGNSLNLPLAVLVNDGSASAAEIVAGAVKDTGTGLLVGQKTFGKGVVQMVFELGNEAGLKLTTARYLTPDKHDINKKGIEPDVVVEPENGTDLQLQKAIDIVSQKLRDKAA